MTIAKDCIELICKKLSHEISRDEYYCGIMELESKYPNLGFKKAAEDYANKIRRDESKSISTQKIDRKMAAAGDMEEEVPF